MCECLRRSDELLRNDRTSNAILDVAILWDKQTGQLLEPRAKVALLKRDRRIRRELTPLIANYCPFCGKKYE